MTLETRATVVRVDEAGTYVESSAAKGCGQCNGKGCGSAKLSQMLCSEPRLFQIDNAIDAVVGDQVVISVADGTVLRGIALLYLFPLMLLVIGAMLGNSVAMQDGQRDAYAATGAAIGLIAGFLLSRWFDSRQPRRQRLPRIVAHWREE